MANIIISSENSKNCRRNNWNMLWNISIIIKFIEMLYFLKLFRENLCFNYMEIGLLLNM